MSDALKHECGIAMVRLLKPLQYYKDKYGSAFYGINKMYLLMEKQHNRGQDGAGFASVKFNVEPGTRYISRIRSNKSQPIQDVFAQINERLNGVLENNPTQKDNVAWQEENMPYGWQFVFRSCSLWYLRKKQHRECSPFFTSK